MSELRERLIAALCRMASWSGYAFTISPEAAADVFLALPELASVGRDSSSQSQPSVAREPISRADTEAEPSAAWRELERATAPIGFQDVRLAAGEGKLSTGDVLMAVNAILRRRFDHGATRLPNTPLSAGKEG